MKGKRCLVQLALLLSQATGFRCQSAGSPQVSLVVDAQPGPAAAHGLGKLRTSLQAKQLSCEQVSSPAAAQGNILILPAWLLVQGRRPKFLPSKVASFRACRNHY
jgi:hypothetical protein